MRHLIRAVFILISMTSNNALSLGSKKAEAPPVIVKIEDYNFEFQQFGSAKAFVEASASEEEWISPYSVTFSYTLKGDNLVETPTLLDSLNKAAVDKCNDLASGSADGDIVSKERVISPWKISGTFICALKRPS